MPSPDVPAGVRHGDASRHAGEEIDILDPPASRPTWFTLVYAIAFALGAALLMQWPQVARFLGI